MTGYPGPEWFPGAMTQIRKTPSRMMFLTLTLTGGPVAAQTLAPTLAGRSAMPTVSADPAQRAEALQSVEAAGPAPERSLDLRSEHELPDAAAAGAKASVVILHGGRPLPGAVRVARNRIYDPISAR